MVMNSTVGNHDHKSFLSYCNLIRHTGSEEEVTKKMHTGKREQCERITANFIIFLFEPIFTSCYTRIRKPLGRPVLRSQGYSVFCPWGDLNPFYGLSSECG